MTQCFRLGADGIYRCDALEQFEWQEHGFGTRTANPRADITLRQIHSDRVVNARDITRTNPSAQFPRDRDREREGDALISGETGIAIGIRTADCVPLLLLDTERRAVGAVHAGWRGTAARIVARAVERLSAEFGSEPQNIYAALGPCIRACCYEVGEAVAAQFESAGVVDRGPNGKHRVDLAEANRRQLESAGLLSAHIFDAGLCTACLGEQFFSYRREPENPGRMLAAICRVA